MTLLSPLKPFYSLAQNLLDTPKSWLDVNGELIGNLKIARNSEKFQHVFDKSEPLVSVCVGTYNRAAELMERCIPSILNQTYQNLEVIIVGDACTDDTFERLNTFKDLRLRFVNLPQRGDYPSNPRHRWMVAGTQPTNHALNMSTGDFITHLDDDDEYLPDRIEKLVRYSQEHRLELVWHPFFMENQTGDWYIRPCHKMMLGGITTSSSFYHGWFKRIEWNINAWKLREPGDWNRFRKFKYIKVKALRYPEPLLRHYRERNQ